MKSKLAFLFICHCFILKIYAQIESPADSLEKRHLQLSSLHVGFGSFVNSADYVSLFDFRRLAPNSVILSKDYDGYAELGGRGSNSGLVNLAIGAKLLGPSFFEKAHPYLRLGVLMGEQQVLNSSLWKFTKSRLDTLRNGAGTDVYYQDSVYEHKLDMSYDVKQLWIDGSIILQSSDKSRLNVFAGLGFAFGASFAAKAELREHAWYSIQLSKENQKYGSKLEGFESIEQKRETFNSPSSFSAYLYFPVGLDFRIKKNNLNFWHKVHLFTEVRPGAQWYSIPNLNQRGMSFKVSHVMGLRMILDEDVKGKRRKKNKS